jgi:hypothetical protein
MRDVAKEGIAGALGSETPPVLSSAALPEDCDARIRLLHDYWRGIHPPHGLPGRQHVEPLDLTRLWRWLWLVDVARAPLRFRCRLVGTSHREVLGIDLTGRWLDEAFAGFAQSQGYADMLAVAQGELRYCRREPGFPTARRLRRMERVLLPLARDGATVDMMLCLSVFIDEGGRVV